MYQSPREVRLKTKIELLKHRPVQTFVAIYLILFGVLFATFGVTLTLSFVDKTVPSVDYEEINKKGKLTIGEITNIETQYKLTINNEHPTIIGYKYKADGQEFNSKYQILAPDKVSAMKIGDKIEIKFLDNESIINGIEPSSFPVWIFVLIPFPFFIIGIVLIIPSIMRFKKDLSLYKYGKVVDAELISMMPKSGFMFSSFGQRILANYKYQTSAGQNALGESIITDFSIINEKKQGDMIKIFVSEQEESKSCLIPKLEAIRNNWRIQGVDV